MRKTLFILFISILICSISAQDLSDSYIIDYGADWEPDIITLNKVGSKYIFIYDVPTSNGRKSFSSIEIGSWDGEQIILDNGYSIYALKPQPDGTLHYYAIEGGGEFPGKDFRPITEEDLIKIAEMK